MLGHIRENINHGVGVISRYLIQVSTVAFVIKDSLLLLSKNFKKSSRVDARKRKMTQTLCCCRINNINKSKRNARIDPLNGCK